MAYNQLKSVHCEKLHLFNLNRNNMVKIWLDVEKAKKFVLTSIDQVVYSN